VGILFSPALNVESFWKGLPSEARNYLDKIIVDTLILDGYNVIYAIPVLRKIILKHGPAKARESLIDLCVKYRGSRRDISCIYIVFDAPSRSPQQGCGSCPGQLNFKGVKVIFSQGKKEADDVIIEFLKNNDPAESFIVVSSDNYVCNNSRIYSARVMSPTAFRNELGKKVMPEKKPGKKISDDIKVYKSEVTDWYEEELKKGGIEL